MGHAQEKFTPRTEMLAREVIRSEIALLGAKWVVSGHSPMGGVDIYAEEIALESLIPTMIFGPTRNDWSGPGGFKERNLRIAQESDLVLVVVVEELPPGYKGMVFKDCYHCKGRNPPHIKSGGCWTAWKATRRKWVVIK